MPEARVYQEAFGIATGDSITTSYGTGPYEVWSIFPPRYLTAYPGTLVIRTWPVISLTLITPGTRPRLGLMCDFFWINEIRQEGARWFTDANDEVFVVKPATPPALPVDMFRSFPPVPAPYPFDPDVNYQAGPRLVWHCERCTRDFNTQPAPPYSRPPCPQCGWGLCHELMLMPPRRP